LVLSSSAWPQDDRSVAQFCVVEHPDQTRYTTSARTLFEAASNVLNWTEVECQLFNTARRFRNDQILTISVQPRVENMPAAATGAIAPADLYRVRIGRVRAWLAGRARD
jgi:hypothetical protein